MIGSEVEAIREVREIKLECKVFEDEPLEGKPLEGKALEGKALEVDPLEGIEGEVPEEIVELEGIEANLLEDVALEDEEIEDNALEGEIAELLATEYEGGAELDTNEELVIDADVEISEDENIIEVFQLPWLEENEDNAEL